MYYIAGDYRGMVYDYGVSGKLYKKYKYNNYGNLVGIYQCDTNGIVIDSAVFPTGTVQISIKGQSGAKYFEGKFLSSNAHGKHQWFFPNGKMETSGDYVGGNRNGDWIWYHPNGKIESKGAYLNGSKTGEWIYYDYFGNIIRKGDFMYGDIHGKYTWYYEDGKLWSQTEFYEDDRHNAAYYYARTGELREVRYYEFGKFLGYSYQDKNKQMVDTIYTVNGAVDVKAYFPNGILSADYSIKCGEYHGSFKIFYADGKLQEERLYEYGLEIGPTKEYHSNGKLARIENYNYGQLNGEVIEYYDNGAIKLHENYMNDGKQGLCEYFDKTGKKIGSVIYNNNEVLKINL